MIIIIIIPPVIWCIHKFDPSPCLPAPRQLAATHPTIPNFSAMGALLAEEGAFAFSQSYYSGNLT